MVSELRIHNFNKNSKMAVAAQLRLVAEQLEQDNIQWKSGGIKVGANHTGEMTIESDLILSCKEQPMVEPSTNVEEITLFTTIQEQVYDILDKLDPNGKKCVTFDHGEHEQVQEWMRIIRNRGEYPEYLTSRMFEVRYFRSSAEIGFWISRIL